MSNETKETDVVTTGRAFVFTSYEVDSPPVFPCEVDWKCQLEKCPTTGKLHYQGYCRFPKTKTIVALKKILPLAHWENRRGSHKQAYDYVTKEETRVSDPIGPMSPILNTGAQTRAVNLASDRSTILSKRKWSEVVQCDALTNVMQRYPKWCREVFDHRPRDFVEGTCLFPWQDWLLSRLLIIPVKKPETRVLYWLWDNDGMTGKSWMARYLASNHDALYLCNGKTADIAHTYEGQTIIVVDLPKSMDPETVNYAVIEQLKNGCIFSPKYSSCTKIFPIPQVVVFANFSCPIGKFSPDRLFIHPLDVEYDYVACRSISLWDAVQVSEPESSGSVAGCSQPSRTVLGPSSAIVPVWPRMSPGSSSTDSSQVTF